MKRMTTFLLIASLFITAASALAAEVTPEVSAVLTPEQAEALLLESYPDAQVFLIFQDRDDGRLEYEIYFSTDSHLAHVEMNAETGALLDVEMDHSAPITSVQGPLSADEAKELVLSLVTGGKIVEFETEREDGRKVYEGEVRSDDGRFEFSIDAETGRITEWDPERK